MSDKLLNIIEDFQSDRSLNSLSEADVKQGVVLRTLDGLNWSIYDLREVRPEYSVAKRRVDYALLIDNAPQVFVEVKKGGEPLANHQEQLLDYAFREGIKLAILTNGVTWWFYLPLRAGSWEQRRFATVELDKQDKAEIAQTLVDFLSKENVGSGKASRKAEDLHDQNQTQAKISETLPEAWRQLVSKPDDLLVDLLAEKTEELCGHKPDKNEVEQFLLTLPQPGTITPPPEVPEPFEPPEPMPGPSPSVVGTKLKKFTLNGSQYEVNSWADGVRTICKILSEIRSNRFEEVLRPNSLGHKRIHFSKKPAADFSPEDLQYCKKVGKTDIHVYYGGTANQKKKFMEDLANHFGYNDFSYILHE